MKTFLILDGNALLHRAWHAIPPLTTKDGRVVNAAYGFTNVVEKMRDQFQPDYMAVAWDLPGKTFRHDAFEAYKGTREKKEEELYAQIEIIQEILNGYGIPSLSVPGYEADDVIGTLATHYGGKDMRAMIVTGDMDALQLVDDEKIQVVAFVKGLSETKTYDEAAVRERYGLAPNQLIDFKALMGDPSDNIPGLPGIGKKTASGLLQEYGTIDGIFDALKRGSLVEKYAKKFAGQEQVAEAMKHLVTIVRDIPLPDFDLEKAKIGAPNVEKLRDLFRDLEFRTLLKRYESIEGIARTKPLVRKKTDVEIVSFDDFEFTNKPVAVFLLHEQQDLFSGEGTVAFFNGRHVAKGELSETIVRSAAVNIFEGATEVIGHDLKKIMHEIGICEKKLFDTMVAAYLLAPGTRNFDFDTVLYEQLRVSRPKNASADELVLLEWQLGDHLKKSMREEDMERVMDEIEMPLIPVLCRMEKTGIAVDTDRLKELSKTFAKDLERLTSEIYKLAGREFNVNSPFQLADVLFVDLELPTKGIKKTKSGYSTASTELEKLWEEHKIIPLISEYRELAKLKSTYVDTLPTLVKSDGRIHTTYNQTIAATGRLSSIDPNLQNIPIRTSLGNEVRKAFVAREGYRLLAADYSQIELRLAAVIAKDESFIRAFKDGADIHTRTAAEILGKDEKDVTKEERYAAKSINFGILYGMGPRNLARSTGFSQQEAKKFIEKYFELHPGIRQYIDEMKVKAHSDEYVTTLFGRKRYLPDINSNIQMLKAAAERMAVNMPLQGTQADLIKLAMIEIDEWLTTEASDAFLLLQVHDELVFEVPEAKVDRYSEQIASIMSGIYTFEVPLVANCKVGENWGEMVEE